jgi:16S rRNA (adenine(1408)-N(1))-methyltransferase
MIDLGTGDGRAVLATAAAEPRTLVIGIDANAASMAESSRRAARSACPGATGGLENALFVVAAADAIPSELTSIARRVTIAVPWGSLLAGCLGGADAVTAGIAGLVAPNGSLELLLAPAGRDRLAGFPTDPDAVIAAATRSFEPHGLRLDEAGLAGDAVIRRSGSTWARRLLSNPASDRRVIAMRFEAEGVTMGLVNARKP